MADIGDISNQQPRSTRNITAEELEIIKYFVQGKQRSASNRTLKLEHSENALRLTDAQGKLLGISRQMNECQQKILVRQDSKYTAAIKQMLFDREFLASQKSLHPDFDEYHHYRLPKGYKLNYTEALQLWKVWWNSKRYQLNSQTLQLDVLVFNKNNWYPIEDLRPNQGNFVLKTSIGEMMIPATDRVVWIDKAEATASKAPSTKPSPPPISVPPPPPPPQPPNISKSGIPTEVLPGEPEVGVGSEQPVAQGESEIADLDLEIYLNTFDTDESEDVDRIESIYNIDELLSEQRLTDDPTIEELFTHPTPTEPVVVDKSGQVSAEFVISNPPTEQAEEPIASGSPAETSQEPSLTLSQRKQALKLKALQVLTDYLQRGEEITTIEAIANNTGQTMSQKTTAIKRGCPSWVVEQVKSKS